MLIKELIDILKQYPVDTKVFFSGVVGDRELKEKDFKMVPMKEHLGHLRRCSKKEVTEQVLVVEL